MSERLIEQAKEAITEVFNDTSVTKAETYTALTELKDDIDIMLDSLEIDN